MPESTTTSTPVTAVYAWHWEGEKSIGVVDPIGVVRTEPRAVVGRCGLHASPCPLEALRYAKGGTLQRVRLSGTIAVQDGGTLGGRCNHAATERTALATLTPDVTERVVRAWLFRCVETVARPAAIRSLRRAAEQEMDEGRKVIALRHADALEALPPVVDTASCKLFEKAAQAARAAAWAAWAAAWAAWAAWAAAWDARDAWDAAWDAAWAAARDARAAAWDARDAWDAAWDAARDAAWDAVADDLHQLLMAALAEQGYDVAQEVA